MATAPQQLFDPQAEKLRHIQSIPALVKYLDEELGWPVGVDDWEEAVFDWQPEEFNLKAEHQVAVKSIKQLRPLVTGQPWGIFFVDFDKGKLPITVLRRMLNGLIIKSRVKGSGHQTWMARDLLFVSSFGEGSSAHPREIALAHFTDESDLGDIPILRVLGWDEANTSLELSYVARTLKEKLRWPLHTAKKSDQDAWRAQWAGAFSLQYRQVINDSKSLALALAVLAKRIRLRVNDVLKLESEKGHLHQLHKAFRENLIADLSADGFADMFAQTITYGLFTARASRSSGALVADNLSDMVPSTNPFLKELLQDFLSAAGRDRQKAKRVDFDELGINEVVSTLRDVPMDAVLRAFNKDKPGDDPVIHFYELFLTAYDKKMRAKRGVFYTPSPVVQFIVRSVDEILKTEFGIEDGLASTITWGEMLARKPELKLPKFCTADTPFVQVLDPATGTGTFIVEVITQVHAHMLVKWRKQGKVTNAQWQPLWVDYVQKHLLPRLYAFELMMAPYAIAHMKIGLKLAETGYTFPDDGPRVNVFLTNALEPAHAVQPQLEAMAPMLAHEASAANRAKEQCCFTVIVGNPPYANYSSNLEPENRRLVDDYRIFRGQPIRERNQLQFERNIQDDFVKFVSLAERFALRTDVCTVGYITNATMLSSSSLRGMRAHLMQTFTGLTELHLHGGVNESFIDAPEDANVFEIAQAVAIHLYSRHSSIGATQIAYGDLRGSRQQKYEILGCSAKSDLNWQVISPDEKTCAFGLQDGGLLPDITTLELAFRQYGAGVKTNRDAIAIDFDSDSLKKSIYSFSNSIELRLNTEKFIKPIKYRPFDTRLIFFHEGVVASRSLPTMRHMLDGTNIGIITSSSWTTPQRFSVGVSRTMVEMKTGTHDRGTTFFPLYVLKNIDEKSSPIKVHNFSVTFIYAWMQATGLRVVDSTLELEADTVLPENILYWLYAIFHSLEYRRRFSTALAQSFPLVLLPSSRVVFDAVATLGAQLVQWHLLEHPDATKIVAGSTYPESATAFFGTDFSLQKVAEKGKTLADLSGDVGKVFINASSGFAHVRLATWQHTIGGYQVLHKWLDDRRKAGRSLSQDDITHWRRVYAALDATQALMQQVDEAIDAHGGWPGAFSQNHPPPDAATLAVEQAAQKEQLKAHKKAAIKKVARDAGTGWTEGLFDSDSDLDEMATAAGAPPRPKSEAAPAKAAGGKTSSVTPRAEDLTDDQLMCALRAVLAESGALAPNDLIRQTARRLGFARTGAPLRAVLEKAIGRAARRGIAAQADGLLSLEAKSIEGYDRDFLKQHLLGVVGRAWRGTAEVPVRFARALGFARTGPKIEETVWKLMHALVRAGQVDVQGRAASARYRKARTVR